MGCLKNKRERSGPFLAEMLQGSEPSRPEASRPIPVLKWLLRIPERSGRWFDAACVPGVHIRFAFTLRISEPRFWEMQSMVGTTLIVWHFTLKLWVSTI